MHMPCALSLLALLLATAACGTPSQTTADTPTSAPPPASAPDATPEAMPAAAPTATEDPALPSWNDGLSKQAILDFVQRVTTEGHADYVPPAERIAVFDNDGTLWCEQPMYVQLSFALDRLKARPPQGKKLTPALRAMQEGGLEAISNVSKQTVVALVKATHSGCSPEEFERDVRLWLEQSRHPRSGRPYTEMVYQPMLELLAFLEAHGFTNYVASAGGVEFMRPWTAEVYGIPPERVIGSRMALKLEERKGRTRLTQLEEIDALNDKEAKPVGIWKRIGRRPVAAFGNSDGDLQMLQWCTDRNGASFGMLIRHTDAEREWAYDRDSEIGKLDEALDQAGERGWTVVDMRADWNQVFPPEAEAEDPPHEWDEGERPPRRSPGFRRMAPR